MGPPWPPIIAGTVPKFADGFHGFSDASHKWGDIVLEGSELLNEVEVGGVDEFTVAPKDNETRDCNVGTNARPPLRATPSRF